MPCFKPLTAFQPLEGGALFFSEKKNCRELQIPCGQCIGCRLKRQNAWVVRAMCESQMHDENWFPTFTYSEDHLPMHGSLLYSDVQSAFRAMRYAFGPFRYFVAGEYGDSFARPHYHALMFGLHLHDLEVVKTVGGQPIYRSVALEKAWGKGNVFLGLVTPQSARYCASYTLKKVTGKGAADHYSHVDDRTGEIVELVPEFARMSLKPGLGAAWLDKYWPEVVTHDGVVMNGRVNPVPRFFDRRMRAFEDDSIVASIEAKLDVQRAKARVACLADSTRERLAVREQCVLARVKFHAER